MTAMGLAEPLRRTPWLGYGAALLLALAATATRLLLLHQFHGYPFLTCLPVVVLAAFLAGLGPALLCCGVSAFAAVELFSEPGAPSTFGPNPIIAIGLFMLVGAFIGLTIDIAVKSYLKLEKLQGERRAALEEEVRSRTAERNRLWSLSQDPFLITDRKGIWIAASPAWERILGWPIEERIGKSGTDITHPDDRDATRREIGFVFSGGQSIRFQNRYRTRDGSYRWFSWTAVAEAGRMYAVARDVTEIKETARELEQTQEALIQSQKIEAMGKVTGGVAHDFNNLLTPILGGLDLVKRKGLPDARMERLVDGALQAAERARTLVQRLLAFARRQPLQVISVDLAGLIESLADLIESTIGPRIRLTVELAPSLPHVRADSAQLEMALLNLAVNARDAMPEGGSLGIAATPVRLSGGGEGLGAGVYVRMTVADTGIGMTAQVAEHAIEPFYSTKGVGHGTGLGLSMVHGLMAQLGGALRIESTPGEGTRVHLWLPVSETAAERRVAADDAELVKAAGNALLIDDEELVRASVGAMLADLGYAVTEAESGAAALDLIDSHRPFDLIVTDHLMPGMTGTEFAEEVRRRAPDQRIVIISGYSDIDDIAPDFTRLAKPFRQEELAEAIRP
ncbi:MAG: response regulator [Proteobacteria bacterium]|nr:response regulator [Pseudomonadota bacterium]